MFDDSVSLALIWSTVILAIAIVAITFRQGFQVPSAPPPAIGSPHINDDVTAEAVVQQDEDVFGAVFQNILNLPPMEGNYNVPPPAQREFLAEE